MKVRSGDVTKGGKLQFKGISGPAVKHGREHNSLIQAHTSRPAVTIQPGPVLVIGMFYASSSTAEAAGVGSAAFRDRVRLQALEGSGFTAHTINHYSSDTPDMAEPSRHVNGNMNSCRIVKDIQEAFPGVVFNAVLLDYFRFPGKRLTCKRKRNGTMPC
jgi:hypothetical protein